MPFEIVRNDITNMRVDAIVNTANPQPTIGFGVDAGIHEKAGPELLAARVKIGRIRVGDAAVTPGFNLPARFVIHTVGPVWRGGGNNEEKLLASCYERSLALAKRHGCRSVAFPLIAAGNYGFPPSLALQTAMDAIGRFLMKNEMQVYLVVFDREAFQLSEKLFRGITSFIDETTSGSRACGSMDWRIRARRRTIRWSSFSRHSGGPAGSWRNPAGKTGAVRFFQQHRRPAHPRRPPREDLFLSKQSPAWPSFWRRRTPVFPRPC